MHWAHEGSHRELQPSLPHLYGAEDAHLMPLRQGVTALRHLAWACGMASNLLMSSS